MRYDLDQSVTFSQTDDQRWQVDTDRSFWNGDSAFGGWQAAVCAMAVRNAAQARGQVVSQQVMFQAPVRGESLLVDVRLMEQRRSLDFWQVTLVDPQSERMLSSCQLVMGERTPTAIGFEIEAPDFPDFEASFPIPGQEGMPTWFGHYDIRLAKGRPFRKSSAPRSATWVCERDGRPLDDASLLAISDTPMPRTFFCADDRVPASTIALGTHIYATPGQIAENGGAPVLLDTGSRVVRDGLINQETAIFRQDGLLLAMSYQTGVFRER